MNESMLKSLMRLFAIMVSIDRGVLHVLARNYVEAYLIQQFSRNLADCYLSIFDEYTREMEGFEKARRGKKISALSVKILAICQQIVEELHITQRFMILLSLIRFTRYFSDASPAGAEFSNTVSDAVRTIADGLLITEEEYANCTAFIKDKFYNVPRKDRLLIVSDDPAFMEGEIRHLQKDRLGGQLFILKIERAGIYLFQYSGRARLEVNGKYVFPRHVYLLPRGGSIRGEGMPPIYYSDIVSAFIDYSDGLSVHYHARDLEYHFRNSRNGIQPFSFTAHSGQLVGIIGGSGTGKSTLLKLLNGGIAPDAGEILINGHRLSRKSEALKGMIGYIPQDDLLIEELSVYQNLLFNARLCLDGLSRESMDQTVDHLLKDLDLYQVRDLEVGSPLNKYISGGQRKRLNIALELIREPHILFVDEPTSGLSSTDSENVMALLKEQTLKGKLVMSTIHQPSSELFKQFDLLIVLDRGGYPVYTGNPLDGITYFKELAGRVDATESECLACGNSQPDDILHILEDRNVDEYGAFTPVRKTSPEEWYRKYKEQIESGMHFPTTGSQIPSNQFKTPASFKQFRIFFRRNLLSKLADRQFMSIALVVSPLLALVLGYFSKYVVGDATHPHRYVFSQNENLPAYLFMSVVVALFLGLIISAEEIIKDRRIRERESFLKLNTASYLLAKIAFLFILSGIQMGMFVLLGNLVMGIRGMTFSYWLILFSTACFANLLGLNISDGLKSVVAIYVIVPFLLVPQILLAGVIVKFDRLYYRFASDQVVPLAGDLMASRWAYEALAVQQFTNNDYQKDLYDLDRLESNISYDLHFLVPTLIQELEDAIRIRKTDPEDTGIEGSLGTIRQALGSIYLTRPYPHADRLVPGTFTIRDGEEAVSWLRKYQAALRKQHDRISVQKDRQVDSLIQASGGREAYLKMKDEYHNDQLAQLVLNRSDLHKVVKKGGLLVRKMDPVYMPPVKKNGRAHFYASVKLIGNNQISTFVFNLLAIWFMTLCLYVLLSYSVLRMALEFFADLRRKDKFD